MDFRTELRERLQRVPFSAARIAREADLSREWVAKARKGTAHKLGWDTAQRIHAAIDKLADQAKPTPPAPESQPPPQQHPGIDAMIALLQASPRDNAALLAELEALLTAMLPRPLNLPGQALDVALALLREPPQ